MTRGKKVAEEYSEGDGAEDLDVRKRNFGRFDNEFLLKSFRQVVDDV